jgi:large subunit ribosomal protein L2
MPLSNSLFIPRPVTPSLRGTIRFLRGTPSRNIRVKSLTRGARRPSFRDSSGHCTRAGRGGGNKLLRREVTFNLDCSVSYKVLSINYDPNRTANIALIQSVSDFDDKKALFYIIAPQGLKDGDVIAHNDKVLTCGLRMKLKDILMGTFIHCVEINPGRGGVLVRSAGTYATLLGKELGYALLRMPSGEVRKINLECEASVGVVSNVELKNQKIGKAGKNRNLGIRPRTRAMETNPVDKRKGGRSSSKKQARLPTSRNRSFTSAKGHKTRRVTRTDRFIERRRQKKK